MKFELTERESFIVKNSIDFLENYRDVSLDSYYFKNESVFSFKKNKNIDALNLFVLSIGMIEKFLNLNLLNLNSDETLTYKSILIGECSSITSVAAIKNYNMSLTSNIKNALFNYELKANDREYNELKDDPKINMSDLKYMKMIISYIENLYNFYSKNSIVDTVYITYELMDILIKTLKLINNNLSDNDIKELIPQINKTERFLVDNYDSEGLILLPIKNVISELFLQPN